jgi:hypothetical protein
VTPVEAHRPTRLTLSDKVERLSQGDRAGLRRHALGRAGDDIHGAPIEGVVHAYEANLAEHQRAIRMRLSSCRRALSTAS